MVTGWVSRTQSGTARADLRAVAYLSMTIWAYEELAYGSNWFRRLLGAAFLVILVIRVSHAIHG